MQTSSMRRFSKRITNIIGRLKYVDVPLSQSTKLYLTRRTKYAGSLLKTFIEVIFMLAGNKVYQFSETNFRCPTVLA